MKVDKVNKKDSIFNVTPFQQMIASCTGALVTSFVMTPLDVVKIRLQVQQNELMKCFTYCNGLMDHLCPCISNEDVWYRRSGNFSGTLDAVTKILKNEGIPSLWSGLSPTLLSALPATVFYFVSYEQLRLHLNYEFGYNNIQPLWVPFSAACLARFLATILVSPVELIRTKMQATNLGYLEIHKAVEKLIQYNGYKGLWKGLSPTLLRDVPFSGIYWFGYETIKTNHPENKLSFWASFLAGTASGTLAAILTTPFDVIKTHQQVDFADEIFKDMPIQFKNSTFTILKQIYTQNGLNGLFAGLVPRTLRIAPACAIMISTFEYGKGFFENNNQLKNDS